MLLRARVRGSARSRAAARWRLGFPQAASIQAADGPADRQRRKQRDRRGRDLRWRSFRSGGALCAGRFRFSQGSQALEAVEQDFAKFAAAWKESADLRDAARSPLIDPQEKAKALGRCRREARRFGPRPQSHRRRRAEPPRGGAAGASPPPTARWSPASAAPAKSKSISARPLGDARERPPSSKRWASSSAPRSKPKPASTRA